jgi:hypothetical protein
VKWCPGCNRHLMVATPSSIAFNRKTDTVDGLQPYCRTCDWLGKATLDEAWNRFSIVLRKEPMSARLWTKESYLDMLGAEPTCNWCGSICREWGIGHWIDRQSSDYGHVPTNSVVCCSPCNFHKGHKPSQVHEAFLRSLLQPSREFPQGQGRHPWGKIPWNDYPSSSRYFRRVAPPDLSEHVIPDPQMVLAI